MPSSSSSEGLLLVGHGTRDLKGTEQFFQLSRVLTQRAAPLAVEPCLLELQEPRIDQGWRRLVERGVRHVRVVPLLLFTAGHARGDIPAAVSEAARSTPGVTYAFARPLSRDPRVVDLVTERILESEKRGRTSFVRSPRRAVPANEVRPLFSVLMVGRGSHDACARTDMFLLAETVRRRLGLSEIDVAFYAMSQPPLPEVLERVAQSASMSRVPTSRVVVYPHLLFTGRLYEAIQAQVAEAARRHPHVRFAVASYLGPQPPIADALWSRACEGGMGPLASAPEPAVATDRYSPSTGANSP